MTNHQRIALVCAVTGSVLMWIPIGLMIVTALIGSISAGRLLMDYFMPAELYYRVLAYLVLAGWILLVVGSVLSQRMRIPVVSIGVIALGLFIGCQIIPAEGLGLYLVYGMLILYDVLVIVLGIIDIRLSHAVKTGV